MRSAPEGHRVSLPTRIHRYLSRLKHACHYTTIAEKLHVASAKKVATTCNRMASTGRLQWCGEGLYRVGPTPPAPPPRDEQRGRTTARRPHLASWQESLLRHEMQAPTSPLAVRQRARMILRLADGWTITQIAQTEGVARMTIYKWVERWHHEGLQGLQDRKRGVPLGRRHAWEPMTRFRRHTPPL